MSDLQLDKDETGLIDRTFSNMVKLLDRYVPRHTRAEVFEMARIHEAEVFALLRTIHEYREQLDRALQQMEQMEREFYSRVRMPISLGAFSAEESFSPLHFVRTYSVTWRPDPLRISISMAEEPFVNEVDTPALFEMVSRQFEREAIATLIPALKRSVLELYASAASRRT